MLLNNLRNKWFWFDCNFPQLCVLLNPAFLLRHSLTQHMLKKLLTTYQGCLFFVIKTETRLYKIRQILYKIQFWAIFIKKKVLGHFYKKTVLGNKFWPKFLQFHEKQSLFLTKNATFHKKMLPFYIKYSWPHYKKSNL